MVMKVSAEQFKTEVLEAESLVMVDLYADWCGPCKMMAPIIDALSVKNPDVKFCKVNIDEAMEIAQSYRVAAVPTFLFFKGGQVVDKIVGGTSADEFQNAVTRLK